MQLFGVREIGSNVLKNTSETSIWRVSLEESKPVQQNQEESKPVQQNRARRHYSKVDCPQHRLEEQKGEEQGLRLRKNL
jgi:ribosomal protein L24